MSQHDNTRKQLSVYDILSKIRNENNDNKVSLGKAFEMMTLKFFRTDTMYKDRFTSVQLWSDWSNSDKGSGKKDTGVDLVATEEDGSLTAIQCKCYKDDVNITVNDITNFKTTASRIGAKQLIFVHTAKDVNGTARYLLNDKNYTIIDKESLDHMDWTGYPNNLRTRNPYKMYPHQEKACSDTVKGLETSDRGKLIMACGTGKTLTSLRIAEMHLKSKLDPIILYLVPSITLISQTMREWSDNRETKQSYLAVCSDKTVSKKDKSEDGHITELESRVSTKSNDLTVNIKNRSKDKQLVIFCTYNSIRIVSQAINNLNLKIDLCLCDEAHRTAGVQKDKSEKKNKPKNDDEMSYYHIVHHDDRIPIKKRVYMTATPRVFSETLDAKAQELDKTIYNMNNPHTFGPEFHNLTFRRAVDQDILCDYKVLVAAFSEKEMRLQLQKDRPFFTKKGDEGLLSIARLTQMGAVWNGIINPNDVKNPAKEDMLQRVIVFHNTIESSQEFSDTLIHSVDDKPVVSIGFNDVVDRIKKNIKKGIDQNVAVNHVDGSNSSSDRKSKLRWLAESDNDKTECRLLSNARCLSEGVDVPALDGIVFMEPRKSMIDVVQSVGRVMRKPICNICKSKKCLDPIKHNIKQIGYVILPVAIPSGEDADTLLADSKSWKNVWQVISALKSHDPDLNMEINQLSLMPDNYGGMTTRIKIKRFDINSLPREEQDKLFRSLHEKIRTSLVKKFGSVIYYANYATRLGDVSRTIEEGIKIRIEMNVNTDGEITSLHNGLKQMINNSVTKEQTIKVVAQHKVLSKVFNKLFDKEFTNHNLMSKILDGVVSRIGFDEELGDLQGFYDEVEKELNGIENTTQKQNLIRTIYENFFKGAEKKDTDKHGVVYTPTEIIDFIIHSTEYLLGKHFKTRFDDRAVKIFDPFTGTGSFIVQLLSSGLIDTNLREKYTHDLFANEILLLAYYVSTINIETTYATLSNVRKPKPFLNLNYTDTLEHHPKYRQDKQYRMKTLKLNEDYKEVGDSIQRNNYSHVHVIMGNPPYSVGQKSANDENPNVQYPELDKRIQQTYIDEVKKINKNIKLTKSLYDSYIRSIRWASDRIGESGIISFITNGSFIRSEVTAGLRACLKDEFNEIWCFDLRGNQRTQGEVSKKEGGKIFGSGSRAPVSITFLIKNPKKKGCTIYYKDIGDYLDRDEKLNIIEESKSIQGIIDWEIIKPDRYHDWINHRNEEFYTYTSIGNNDSKIDVNTNTIFKAHSNGVSTGRDVWVYNSSKETLSKNMKACIDYCIKQNLNNIELDSKYIKWTTEFAIKLKKLKPVFKENNIRNALYRPFFKQYLYLDKTFNERIAFVSKLFPNKNSENIVICIPYKFTGYFTIFITDVIPDLHIIATNQCFPLYIYSEKGDGGGVNNIAQIILLTLLLKNIENIITVKK